MILAAAAGPPRGPGPRRRGSGSNKAETTRRAIVDAARALFAARSPDQVTTREIGERAGCSHTLVSRYFGSKAGLELHVAEETARAFDAMLVEACRVHDGEWPFATLLARLVDDPALARLLVRSVLGELPGAPLAHPSDGGRLLAGLIGDRAASTAAAPVDRSGSPATDAAAVGAFATLSVLLGWLAFEDFYTAACRLPGAPRAVVARAVGDACERIATRCATDLADLTLPRTRRVRAARPTPPVARGTRAVSMALVSATIDLLSSPGPAAISTRAIAQHAKVNQGQIYHLFGSKEALLAAAITASTEGFIESTIADGTLEIPAAARVHLESRAPQLIARLLANDVDIRSVRREFPVFDALLARYPKVPTGKPRGGLADPRLAVLATGAFYQGATVWEPTLRGMLDIGRSVDLRPAIERIMQGLVEIPGSGSPDPVPTTRRMER